jgi:hypothetical protein
MFLLFGEEAVGRKTIPAEVEEANLTYEWSFHRQVNMHLSKVKGLS